MFRKILVPVDFSKKNARAVRIATRLGAAKDATVTLLHVIERVDAGDPRGLSDFYQRLETNARAKMQRLLAASGKVPSKSAILYGNRVDEILRYADEKKIDLIVMNSHRLPAKRPAEDIGTISHKVGILSRCPALLVK
ncbi:MAG TPA: universal stress protein [Thermoanaerobaculia bacterium]|jgi:universal stress protein A